MEKIFIDTNILIYATLENDPRFKRSLDLLTADYGASGECFISVQNLAEMYPNLTGSKMLHPDSPGTARDKIISIALLPSLTVLPVTAEIQRKALDLCRNYGVVKQGYFDMQIVASMIHYGITILLTENVSDFTHITEIEVRSPFQ